ncbi:MULTISPECIES: hypothetical protein [unclassified Curtobacterium]|uniref:hypothetical protein n=1 Tax=unclassified Curtobacterium TaxID=257496 RepID=UPI000F4A0910|nr:MULTISPECIES: hypothetical protein [unclassified Curtobacterium]ROQ06830.1 hypothetical protein EDF41_2084 [Curtobacterium sp. PhB171]ROQ27757.1 hypothetical protein EDF40_0877 [Curtobacterium sp. PhB170]ROS34685.1 hypothetical protein EDF25_1908 [Curtobacterium sp. PhB131]ROS72947.1 hypothetical protein EDF30_0887 [Curtobacterium sp. PhB141]
MIVAVVQAVLLIAGTIALFVLQRGQDRTLAVTFLLFAGTIVTNVDPLYRWLDPLLGGFNVVTVVSDCLMVAGTSTLLWGVAKAVGAARPWLRNAIVVSCAAVVVVVVVAFSVLDKPATTTTFMLDAGSHPAATVYSIAQTVYLGVALGATGLICVLRLREARTTTDLVGLWVLVLGGVLGVVRMVVVVVMDLAHVTGDLDRMRSLALPYDVTTPGAVICVSTGMLLLVVGHRVSRRRRTRRVDVALRRLAPLHARIGADNAYPSTEDPATRLSRAIVEVNDGLRRTRAPLTDAERAVLAEAESALDSA